MKRVLFFFLGLFVFAGCSTMEVPMQITHPADINMKSYKKLALGEFRGNTGDNLVSGIKNNLSPDNFELLDRSQMDPIMKELKLNYSDLANRNEAVKLGKMLAASALLSGTHSSSYKEDMIHEPATCYDDKGNKYGCTLYKRIGVANTSGSVDLVDVSTGKILLSKALGGQCAKETRAFNATPEPINGNSLIGQCIGADVTTFVHAIQPWKQTIVAEFEKDGDVPDYEKAINKIKIGDTEEGIKMLQAAINAAEKNPSVKAKVIAVGYWNLGLIYEYTWEYDKAIAAFKKGFSLRDQDRFVNEINRCKTLQAERKKLLEQQSILRINEDNTLGVRRQYVLSRGNAHQPGLDG